jgi:hypothetical protein
MESACRAFLRKTTIGIVPLLVLVRLASATDDQSKQVNDTRQVVSIADDHVFGPDNQPYTGVVKAIPIGPAGVGLPRFFEVARGSIKGDLAPNEPGAFYVVLYLSGGRCVKVEKWIAAPVPRTVTIPEISEPLASIAVADRTPRSEGGPVSTSGHPFDTSLTRSLPRAAGAIGEEDVVGLIVDLGVRAIKGAAYAPGRVALVSQSGLLDSVVGTATDCVRVDGSSGSCSDVSSVTSSGTRTPLTIPSYNADGQLVDSQCSVTANGLSCAFSGSSALMLYDLARSNSFGIYGKDSQRSSVCIIMPDVEPLAGQSLVASADTAFTTDGRVCRLMIWK